MARVRGPGSPRSLGGNRLYQTSPPVYQLRPPQVMNTPRAAQLGCVEILPNLLMTTLAVVASNLLNPAKPIGESAPQAKYQVQAVEQQQNRLVLGYNPQPQIRPIGDSAPITKFQVLADQAYTRPLTLGINPQPQVRQIGDSAPVTKYQVLADQSYTEPLTLGINPQPQVRSIGESAPAMKSAVQVDGLPNLLGTTLQPVSIAPFVPLDTSQFQPKYQVASDVYPNVLVRGLNPQPGISQSSASAPATKAAVEIDVYPNLLQTTLAPVVAVPFAAVDTSQLQTKYQIQLDSYPNTLVLGINAQPQVRLLSDSAPPPKFSVQVDAYPNLLTSTLFVVPPSIPLPLGLPVDTSQFQAKFQIQVDVYPNVLVLGYPPPPVIASPPTLPTGSLLPGKPPPLAKEELGKGMGPYKRPGQVFGEPDPISPFLTSSAEPISARPLTSKIQVAQVSDLDDRVIALILASLVFKD